MRHTLAPLRKYSELSYLHDVEYEQRRRELLALDEGSIISYCEAGKGDDICDDDMFWAEKLDREYNDRERGRYDRRNVMPSYYISEFEHPDHGVDLYKRWKSHLDKWESNSAFDWYLSQFIRDHYNDIIVWYVAKLEALYENEPKYSFDYEPALFVFLNKIMSLAAHHGNLELLQAVSGQKWVPLNEIIAAHAAAGGQIEILDYLAGLGILPGTDGLKDAAARGYLDVLQWSEDHGMVLGTDIANAALAGGTDSRASKKTLTPQVIQSRIIILDNLYAQGLIPDQASIDIAYVDSIPELIQWLEQHRLYASFPVKMRLGGRNVMNFIAGKYNFQ